MFSRRLLQVPDPRLQRARARLDTLALYPRPVRVDRVRVRVAPWFFRLPRLRRYDGYALIRTILLRRADASDDLVTHELCHVWQMQHRPVHVVVTYLTRRYQIGRASCRERVLDHV